MGSPGSSLGAAWCCFMPPGSIWGSAAWTERQGVHTHDGNGSECLSVNHGVPCVVMVLMWREGGWECIRHHWTILTCLDPYYLLITTPPPPPERGSGPPKCGTGAPQVRRRCGTGAVQVRRYTSKMSVSRGRCRKNDAQGSAKAPSEIIFPKCAFRFSGSAILPPNHHFSFGKLQI